MVNDEMVNEESMFAREHNPPVSVNILSCLHYVP